jgi:hypothetical protein
MDNQEMIATGWPLIGIAVIFAWRWLQWRIAVAREDDYGLPADQRPLISRILSLFL